MQSKHYSNKKESFFWIYKALIHVGQNSFSLNAGYKAPVHIMALCNAFCHGIIPTSKTIKKTFISLSFAYVFRALGTLYWSHFQFPIKGMHDKHANFKEIHIESTMNYFKYLTPFLCGVLFINQKKIARKYQHNHSKMCSCHFVPHSLDQVSDADYNGAQDRHDES